MSFASRLASARKRTEKVLASFEVIEAQLRNAATEQLDVADEVNDEVTRLNRVEYEARAEATKNTDRADRIRNLFL